MLSRELMGLLALLILWMNTLLVVLAASQVLRDFVRRLRRMRRLGVIEALADDAIAQHAVEQVGRRASNDAGHKAILFHDRRYESRIDGGSVQANGSLHVEPATGERAEVWVCAQASACQSLDDFDEAYTWASRARGFERRVATSLTGRMWIVGARHGDRLEAPADAPLLVAAFDPRPWCRRKAALVVGFILAVLAAAAGVTYLALYPPVFGTVSIVGAALGLAFFLLVQPAGTAFRDAVRVPSVAQLRGSWVRPSETEARPAYAD